MPRARSPARDKAKELWLESGKKKLLKDIASELGVSEVQIRKWKNQDEWEPKGNQSKGTLPKTKSNVTIEKEPEILIDNNELTDKQKLFCFYYVKYFNATKAYQKSYSCSYATAGQNGHQLLKNTKVAKEINRLKQELFNDTYIDTKAVLQKWIDIAFSDIGDYLIFGREEIETPDGDSHMVNAVKLKESGELDTSIITEVKTGREGVNVKLADKVKALEFLSKYDIHLSEIERKKLEVEIIEAQLEGDEEVSEETIIVDDKAEMRRILEERAKVNEEV